MAAGVMIPHLLIERLKSGQIFALVPELTQVKVSICSEAFH